MEGSRPPSSDLIRSYSSAVSPWLRRVSGVIARVANVGMEGNPIVAFLCGDGEMKVKNISPPSAQRPPRKSFREFLHGPSLSALYPVLPPSPLTPPKPHH